VNGQDGASRAGVATGQIATGQIAIGQPRHRTVKAAERVAQNIVHDIVAKGLASGGHMPLEAAMATRYGVSRTTLREALRLLETQGLIVLKPGPGGGPLVGTIDPAFLSRTLTLYFHLGATTYDQLMRTQVTLEAACAELAAAHPDRRDLLEFTAPCDCADTPGYREATVGFHAGVYRLADNPALSLLTQAVTHTVSQHVLLVMDPYELRPALIAQHAELAEAIAGGDGQRARQLMADHFRFQHDHFRELTPARVADVVEWR